MKNRFVHLPFRWRRKKEESKEERVGVPSRSTEKEELGQLMEGSRHSGAGAKAGSSESNESDTGSNSKFDRQFASMLPPQRRPLEMGPPPDLRCVSGEVDAEGRWLTRMEDVSIGVPKKSPKKKKSVVEDRKPAASNSDNSDSLKFISLNDRTRSRSRSAEKRDKNVLISTRNISRFHSEFSHTYLARGAFGDVFKTKSKADGITYAIKRIRQGTGSDESTEVKYLKLIKKNPEKCDYLVHLVDSWQETDERLFTYIQLELCSSMNCQQLISCMKTWDASITNYPTLVRNCEYLEDQKVRSEMDFDEGSSHLKALIPEASILKIFHDITSGLKYLHSMGLVHHDVKPSNILFKNTRDKSIICKLGDFGLCGEVGSIVEEGNEGDFSYMPKELLSSSVKLSKQYTTDIFSLGVSMYQLCALSNWVLPQNGPRWHDLRSPGHELEIPSQRSVELQLLLQQMIQPHKDSRPAMENILRRISSANFPPEVFLSDLIKDVEIFDGRREEETARAYEEAVQRCITPTDAMLTSGFTFMNVTPVMSTPSNKSETSPPLHPQIESSPP